MAAHLEGLPASARAIIAMPIPPEIPLTVLSAATCTAAERKERYLWVEQSAHGRHVQLENCGHWLHLELPEVVTAAINELVERARAGPIQ